MSRRPGEFPPPASHGTVLDSPVIRPFQIDLTGKAIRPMNKCVRIPFYHPFQPTIGFRIRPEFVALPRHLASRMFSDLNTLCNSDIRISHSNGSIPVSSVPVQRLSFEYPRTPNFESPFPATSVDLLPALTTYGRPEPQTFLRSVLHKVGLKVKPRKSNDPGMPFPSL
jgi:hypothetical protein